MQVLLKPLTKTSRFTGDESGQFKNNDQALMILPLPRLTHAKDL